MVLLRVDQESTRQIWLYICFLIQPIGINKKALVLMCFAQESTNKHLCYSGFLIHLIGINKKSIGFVQFAQLFFLKKKAMALYEFWHSTHRNQRKINGFDWFCLGINENALVVQWFSYLIHRTHQQKEAIVFISFVQKA